MHRGRYGDSNKMRVFITGHLGYVGNILTKILLEEGFEITGCDTCYYPQDGFVNLNSNYKNNKINHLIKDIRDLTELDLRNHDAVIHLAALSNDPLGEMNSSWTDEINRQASIKLSTMAKKVGVKRFIFSSSCSVYGAKNTIPVDETSPIDPLTEYAKSKIESESVLLNLKDENFHPTCLRSATAYGLSSSMRLDLVANNLTAYAYATGKVRMLTDGTPWRPLVHVEDMAKAFISVINSTPSKVSGEVFNVGSDSDNYTVKDIANIVAEVVPNSEIEYAEGASGDPRSYRVNFTKIKERIGFSPHRKLKEAIEEMYNAFRIINFNKNDFDDKKFHRIKYLRWLIQQDLVDNNLRKKKA